jgi:hypothetical protein
MDVPGPFPGILTGYFAALKNRKAFPLCQVDSGRLFLQG